MVDVIPAGSRLLAEDLLAWRTGINAKLEGGTAYKTVDTSRNNAGTGTTYTADPHLTLTVVANAVYSYKLHITTTAPATPQLKSRFSTPSGTLDNGSFHLGTTFSASVGATHEVTGITGTAIPYQQEGTIRVGVTGGAFVWQWAQTVANAANTTVHAGSWLQLIRMA